MSISFNEVPSSARSSGVYIEIDNSLANSAEAQQIALIIGKAVSGSPTSINKAVLCMNEDDAIAQFGAESDITQTLSWFRRQDETMPTYAIQVAEDDLAAGLAGLGDKQYHHIITAINDEQSIRDLGEFLLNRWHAMQMIPGLAYVPEKGVHAELITFAHQSNCQLISFMPDLGLGNSANEALTNAEAIGAWVGQIAPSLAIDPCRPLTGLKLNGVYSIADSELDWNERNMLLHEGMSTYKVTATKEVVIDRVVTAYTENASGIADNSYLDIMTPATAMYFRAKQQSVITSKYPRHKLAEDGTNFGAGQAIVTPSIFKTEMFALYDELETAGIVQDADGYKKSFIAELDADNKQRLNYQDSPKFVNGLIIVAGKIQFRK